MRNSTLWSREVRLSRPCAAPAAGEHRSQLDKGGAKALIALKKSLDAGNNVAHDRRHTARHAARAGLGIVLLARLSGRPIMPAAVATSRRKVLEKSWDKTTINLPFGRRR